MRPPHWTLSALTTAALAGCASEPKDAGFPLVQEAVAARTGQQVIWNRRTPEDVQATTAVQALLKGELTTDGAVQVALRNPLAGGSAPASREKNSHHQPMEQAHRTPPCHQV